MSARIVPMVVLLPGVEGCLNVWAASRADALDYARDYLGLPSMPAGSIAVPVQPYSPVHQPLPLAA